MSGNVPAIRFAGFTEPWEQRKFGETFTFLGNNTLSRAELSMVEGACLDIHYGDVLIKYGEVLDAGGGRIPRIADDQKASSLSCPPLQDGDVVIADTAEDEAVGKCSELRNVEDKTIFSGLHTMPCRPIEAFAPGYLGFYINSDAFRTQLLPLMQGIKVISVSRSAIEDTDVCYPSLPEQQAIGSLFSDLDNLITLHQRKHDQLATLKKSLLEKMFPKPGSDVPELRFAGFTEPWEQRKLNQFVSVTSEKNLDGTFAREDVLSVSRDLGVVNQIEFQGRSFAGADVSVYGILRHGDIVYTKSPLRANPYGIIKTNKGRSGIVSTLYATYRARPGVDPDFVQCYFDQDARLNNYLHPLVNKGAKNDMKVSAGNAITGDVCFPEYEEQRLIAMLFDRLDSLITLHQRKHDQLATLKKSLLEKMFV